MAQKSCCLAYFFWFFGGFFGAHHLYLGRLKHALVWWCLPGGYFGLGWIRDLWRIPEYVRDANDDVDHIKQLTEKMRRHKKPPFSFIRFMGEMILGNMLGFLVISAFPNSKDLGIEFDLTRIGHWLSPAATAVGIWIVGNIGRQKGSFLYPLLGCYLLGLPLQKFAWNTGAVVTLAGMIAFELFSKEWRRTVREPTALWKRALVLFLCGGLYTGMWSSYIYFNLRVVTKDGDSIPFRDAVGNFLQSPAVQEFSRNLASLWEHAKVHGFSSTFQQLIDSLDPLGEKAALKVLELKNGASQNEIKSRYRELSKKWHPDRYKNETEKAEANERFMDIQDAYEKLSSIKTRRAMQNKKPQEDEDRVTL